MSGSQLDASIPLRAVAPPPINPLALFNQAAEAQGNALNVQGRQRALAAQTAEQQAYAGARNPDGTYDPARLQAGLSQLPAGAGAAVSQGQALTTAQFGFNTAQQARIAGTVGSLLSQDDSQQTAQAYQAVLRQELAAGTINQSHYDNAIANMPQPNAPPGAFRAYGTRMLVGTLGGPEMANTVLPRNEDVDRGGVIQPTVRQPAVLGGARTLAPGVLTKSPAPQYVSTGGANVPTSGGVPTGGPAIPNTTSPETRAALVQIADPNKPGATLFVPRSSLPGSTGAPVPPSGAAPAATGGSAPQAQAVPAGAVRATADPNVIAQNELDVKAYQAAKESVGGIVSNQQTLGHALDALKLLEQAQLGTGPGSETMHKMYSLLQTTGWLPPGMTDNVANYELAKKALTQFAVSAGNQTHTDLGITTEAAANASVDGVTNKAAQTVVKQKRGQYNQQLAMIDEAPDKTGPKFSQHSSSFLQSTDPRAFSFDDYTPQERLRIIASLGKPDSPAYIKFSNSLAIAARNGKITPPAPTQAATPAAPVAAPGP